MLVCRVFKGQLVYKGTHCAAPIYFIFAPRELDRANKIKKKVSRYTDRKHSFILNFIPCTAVISILKKKQIFRA